MPELRKDPVLGRWIIISTERAKRPSDFKREETKIDAPVCPFCTGNEHMTPPEIVAYRENSSDSNKSGWRLRVVPNKYPALRVEGDLDKKGQGIYDLMNGVGAHEVVIETPEHFVSLSQMALDNVREVIQVYRERFLDLKKDSRMNYIMLFKNVGAPAGASLEHTHTQLIGLPTIPKIVKEEMNGGKSFFDFRGRCIFCDMIAQEKEEQVRLVHQTQHFIAITPFASRFPFETWILPQDHQSSFENISDEFVNDMAHILKLVLTKLEKALDMPPYNFIIHTSPFKYNGCEYYHWHLEIIPRLTKVAGFEWGTDFYINPVLPEDAAQFLREINVEI